MNQPEKTEIINLVFLLNLDFNYKFGCFTFFVIIFITVYKQLLRGVVV